jgi:ribonuclease P protein component
MARFITQHSEYTGFAKSGTGIRTMHFYAAVQTSDEDFALGITISKRVGKAHARNLLKRRIKSFIRLRGNTLPRGFKINLIARSGAAELGWIQLREELDGLLARLDTR